jgi:hypothetical protein
MKKVLFFFIILYILKVLTKKTLPPLEADILIAPGGYRGVYVLGICHYVKNHFNVKNKTFVGFSSGSFNSLFMVLNPEENNKFLMLLFSLKKGPISKFLQDSISSIKKLENDCFDLERLHVAVSTTNGLEYFKQFLTLHDALDCCKSSSFVPFITYNDMFLFYRNKLTLDGAVFYRDVLKKKPDNKLFIEPSMFGRYNRNRIAGIMIPNESFYQMYLNGYNDARKNHTYFERFFKE